MSTTIRNVSRIFANNRTDRRVDFSRKEVRGVAMGIFWTLMVTVSLVYGAVSGRLSAVTAAALEGAAAAVELVLVMAGADGFMFRDFQSRNIMVLDNEVYFIDYQGGRQGALHYDVASLLYDAIVKIPESQKEELLDFYIRELTESEPGYAEKFREIYYHFVLVRLLQAMGAFGLRGLHEGKSHFIDSIVPGLQGISTLFEPGKLEGEYPEIQYAIRVAFEKYFVPLHPESKE